MIYLPELYYFYDQEKFPFKKAVLVTAKEVAKYCSHYDASLMFPKNNVKKEHRIGILPTNRKEKEKFINNLIEWIFKNSEVKDLFILLLDDSDMKNEQTIARFDHHDDTCCWCLNLDEDEFLKLQKVWEKNNLPKDLFYPQNQSINCCSPKKWKNRNTKEAIEKENERQKSIREFSFYCFSYIGFFVFIILDLIFHNLFFRIIWVICLLSIIYNDFIYPKFFKKRTNRKKNRKK